MEVKMLKSTSYFGLKKAGEIYEVPDDVAKRWYGKGIATVKKAEVAEIESVEVDKVEEEAEDEEMKETPEEEEAKKDELRDKGRNGELSVDRRGNPSRKHRKAFGKSK